MLSEMMDRNFGYDWKNSKIHRRFKQPFIKGFAKSVCKVNTING